MFIEKDLSWTTQKKSIYAILNQKLLVRIIFDQERYALSSVVITMFTTFVMYGLATRFSQVATRINLNLQGYRRRNLQFSFNWA